MSAWCVPRSHRLTSLSSSSVSSPHYHLTITSPQGLYMDGYFAAKQLGESVLDLLTMVAGTIPPDRHEIRMEFWRCANLFQ